jgi:hypothetical protein
MWTCELNTVLYETRDNNDHRPAEGASNKPKQTRTPPNDGSEFTVNFLYRGLLRYDNTNRSWIADDRRLMTLHRDTGMGRIIHDVHTAAINVVASWEQRTLLHGNVAQSEDPYHDPEFYKDPSPFSAQRALASPTAEYQNDPNREHCHNPIHPSDVINNNLWVTLCTVQSVHDAMPIPSSEPGTNRHSAKVLHSGARCQRR